MIMLVNRLSLGVLLVYTAELLLARAPLARPSVAKTNPAEPPMHEGAVPWLILYSSP